MRQCCKSERGFTIRIIDNLNQVLLSNKIIFNYSNFFLIYRNAWEWLESSNAVLAAAGVLDGKYLFQLKVLSYCNSYFFKAALVALTKLKLNYQMDNSWAILDKSSKKKVATRIFNQEFLFLNRGSCWKPHYELYDGAGNLTMHVNGPCCICDGVCCTCDNNFHVIKLFHLKSYLISMLQ